MSAPDGHTAPSPEDFQFHPIQPGRTPVVSPHALSRLANKLKRAATKADREGNSAGAWLVVGGVAAELDRLAGES